MIYFLFWVPRKDHTLWFPFHSPLWILLPDAIRELKAQSSLSPRSPSGICPAPGFKCLWTLDSDFYLWPSPPLSRIPAFPTAHLTSPPVRSLWTPDLPALHPAPGPTVLPTSFRVSPILPVARVRNLGVSFNHIWSISEKCWLYFWMIIQNLVIFFHLHCHHPGLGHYHSHLSFSSHLFSDLPASTLLSRKQVSISSRVSF